MKRPADLIEEVLDERAQAINLTASDIEAGVAQLRQLFAGVREHAAMERRSGQSEMGQEGSAPGQRRLRYEAVLRPGAYRLRLGDLALRVILGEARRTSRIVIDAARELLSPDPGAWTIVPDAALATRGDAEDLSRVEIAQQATSAAGTVIADDMGDEPRVLVVIRGFPADQPLPVMELGKEVPEMESARVIQVEPEISPERPPSHTRRQRE
jgi:hypothetical protein